MTDVEPIKNHATKLESGIASFHIGIIPWPVYLILLAVIGGFLGLGKLPSDISLMIAVLGVGGFTCGVLGKRIPYIKTLGAAAIFATFIPSYLVYAKLLPKVLVRGFLKVFIPMLAGTLAAGVFGLGVGMAFGMSQHDIFYFVLVPALGGGVGEGALPLSIGYAAITHQDQGVLLARILPAVMFASLTAIVFSGLLNHYARTRPAITGYGTL